MITLRLIFEELFYVLTGAAIIFAGLELAWPGLVLAYINLNWVLILWLAVGIVILIFPNVPYSESTSSLD